MPLVNEQTRIAQHGTWIEIYLDRLLANVAEIKRCAGSGKHIMAVVKANAYGHGLLETAKALEDHVNYLGVSSVIEALEIQNTGIDTPVFLFGRLLPSEVTPAILSGATLCVSSFDEAFAIGHF